MILSPAPNEGSERAVLRIAPGAGEEHLRFAAQVLLDSLARDLPLVSVTTPDAESPGLELPGGATVTTADLEAVFASISLARELETRKLDSLGRFDETALTWDVSKPWVDLRALDLAARTDQQQGMATDREVAYSVHITHDIDRTTLLEPFSLVKSAAHTIGLKRAESTSLGTALTPKALLKGLEGLLNYERTLGIGARFFMLSGPFGLGRHGSRTDSRWASWRESARMIQEAGMPIGLHGSFAASDRNSYREERERLEQALGQAVTTHRNHYLRFDTARICTQLETAGIRHDFSIGYASRMGFRSGSARAHRMFDLARDRESRLLAVPLLFMDSHLLDGDPATTLRELQDALSQVKKVGGEVSLLFHPELLLLDPGAWPFFEKVVHACLDMGADLSGRLA